MMHQAGDLDIQFMLAGGKVLKSSSHLCHLLPHCYSGRLADGELLSSLRSRAVVVVVRDE